MGTMLLTVPEAEMRYQCTSLSDGWFKIEMTRTGFLNSQPDDHTPNTRPSVPDTDQVERKVGRNASGYRTDGNEGEYFMSNHPWSSLFSWNDVFMLAYDCISQDIFGRKLTSHRQVSDSQEAEDDGAQDAHGPLKSDGVHRTNETIPVCYLPDHWDESRCRDGEHDAANGSAHSRNTPGYPTFLLEPISDDACQWTEAHPTRQLWDGLL